MSAAHSLRHKFLPKNDISVHDDIINLSTEFDILNHPTWDSETSVVGEIMVPDNEIRQAALADISDIRHKAKE